MKRRQIRKVLDNENENGKVLFNSIASLNSTLKRKFVCLQQLPENQEISNGNGDWQSNKGLWREPNNIKNKIKKNKVDFFEEFKVFLREYEKKVDSQIILRLPKNGTLESALESLKILHNGKSENLHEDEMKLMSKLSQDSKCNEEQELFNDEFSSLKYIFEKSNKTITEKSINCINTLNIPFNNKTRREEIYKTQSPDFYEASFNIPTPHFYRRNMF